jgi:hypothetical protein
MGNNAEKPQFSEFLPTKLKNDWRCKQQRGTFFRIVGTNAGKCWPLWATARKNG